MEVENLGDLDHAPAAQEFPTLYTVFGRAGTTDLYRLFDSNRGEVAIDVPANDGFFSRENDSPGGWAARAYLLLGNLDTVAGLAAWLEHSLAPFGTLDRPATDERVAETLSVAGWALGNGGVIATRVLIDGAPSVGRRRFLVAANTP